jgi:hypothetical protein
LRYDDALQIVQAIGPDAPPRQRVEALELYAVVLLIRGRSAVAQPLLEELYFAAPAFRLSDSSLPPRVTKMFEEEAARPHKRGVTLELHPVGDDPRQFALRTGGATRTVSLACRGGARGPYLPLAPLSVTPLSVTPLSVTPLSVTTVRQTDRVVFRLPNDGAFACHAVAFDRDGLPLGRLGTASAPFAVRSRPPPEPPKLTERWWFWTAVSGVVVAAAVVTAVAVSADDPPPDADLTVKIPSSAATLARW